MFQLMCQLPDSWSEKQNTQADHHGERSRDAHGASDSASKWLSLQKWIHSHARDVLDESDEILHPRFQLVYTIGPQQHMDGYPDRWTITQEVLRLAKKHVYSLSRYTPEAIEHERGPPGSFPRVRILEASDIGRLTSLITEDIMAGRLPNFNFQHICPELRDAIRSFISDEDVLQVPDTVKKVEDYAKLSDQSHLWSGLLSLRGLLTSKILLFALAGRRWRVDYGLVPESQLRGRAYNSTIPTMLAVPYRAKDVPAPNTQFGHPDLTIILTCLSYYYAGLSEAQLRASFEILLDQDDPSTEYALWIKEYDRDSVPDSLRKLGEINLRSSEQWDNVIFPFFAWNQAAVNFYLSRVIFPKEAKEFPWKLSGSSWDLVEKRKKLISGEFSVHFMLYNLNAIAQLSIRMFGYERHPMAVTDVHRSARPRTSERNQRQDSRISSSARKWFLYVGSRERGAMEHACIPQTGSHAAARNSCLAGCWLTGARSFQSPSGYGVAQDLP